MRISSSILLALLAASPCLAGEVEIVRAMFRGLASGTWRVDVTLRHDDTGWEHYADAWRVVGDDGTALGTRTLFHPHETEQPFTRSLEVTIPTATRRVYVEAHDKVHGWARDRLAVDLERAAGDRYEVSR